MHMDKATTRWGRGRLRWALYNMYHFLTFSLGVSKCLWVPNNMDNKSFHGARAVLLWYFPGSIWVLCHCEYWQYSFHFPWGKPRDNIGHRGETAREVQVLTKAMNKGRSYQPNRATVGNRRTHEITMSSPTFAGGKIPHATLPHTLESPIYTSCSPTPILPGKSRREQAIAFIHYHYLK